MLINLKSQTTVFIILDQLAEVGKGGGLGGQALFEFGVIGVDFGGAVVFACYSSVTFRFFLGIFFIKPPFL